MRRVHVATAGAISFHEYTCTYVYTTDYASVGRKWNSHSGYAELVLPVDFYQLLIQNNLDLQGGSWISTGDEASRFARYAFRRHFVQHCGFRVARSVKKSPDEVSPLPVTLIDKGVYVLGFGVNGR